MAKRLLAIFMAIFFVVCVSSCVSDNAQSTQGDSSESETSPGTEFVTDDGVLKLCMFEVDSLNPLSTQNEGNLDVLRLMFDGLFTVKDNFTVENNICETYSISEDGLDYAFQIRNNIKFHDDSPLTADDVDASFKLITESQNPYSTRFANVEATSSDGMTWYVTLNTPVINFPALLDFPIMPARDAHMENNITDINYVPIGTGLYNVIDYKETKELYLTANENHFSGKRPKIDNIKITFVSDREAAISMFENLYVDILPESAANLDEYTPKRDFTKSITYPKNKITFLGINNQNPLLLSAATRQAISLCIDKNTMVNETKTRIAVPADIPINPYFCYYDAENVTFPFDTVQANELLIGDGFKDNNGDGILEKTIYEESHELILDILVNSENSSRLKIAEAIKTSMEKAGFKVTVTSVDFETYKEQINSKNYDLFVGSINISQNNDLSFMLKTDRNIFGISNEQIDIYLKQLTVLSNTTTISDIYSSLCTSLAENMPVAGIYYDSGLLLCDKKIKGNIKPAESNVFMNIEEWYIG